MHIDLLPGTTNVVRFPAERRVRPTMVLLRDQAPDIREVAAIAGTFGFETVPSGYRDRVDLETARHIAEQAPGAAPSREAWLRDLLRDRVQRAMAACRATQESTAAAGRAREVLEHARQRGGYWLEPLEERAGRLTWEAASLLLEAHARCEEAEGVARATGLALRGERWTPRDVRAEMDALIAFHAAASG